MTRFALPQCETFVPHASHADAVVANMMDVIVRDAVFTALPYFDRGRSPEIGGGMVDVITLDDVFFVEVSGARFKAAQADAATAGSGDFVVDDAVVHRGMVQLNP